MSAPVIISIADAIVTDLNETALSQGIHACRKWLPIFDREQMTVTQVTVVPRAETGTRSSRREWWNDYRIEIGIQRHVKTDNEPEIDDLAFLGQEIYDRYIDTLPGSRTESLINREWLAIVSAQELDEQRIFGSFMALTFRGARDP